MLENLAKKRVGIVLLNWNGLADTTECLQSLMLQDYADFVAVVVDNNSSQSIEPLKSRFPTVLFIENHSNEGFCRGNNIGIKACRDLNCEYIWILNNDTTVASECLGKLVAALDSDIRIAGVTNRIDYFDDREICWFGGGIFQDGIPAHRGYMSVFSDPSPPAYSEYLSGCSFLARTDVLVELGGFNEGYFCYVEDVDLSLRMLNLGYLLAYEPNALVWHKVSRATQNISHIKLYYKHRNMLAFLRSHHRPWTDIRRWWMQSIRTVASLVIKHHQFKSARYLLMGLVHGHINKLGRLEDFSAQTPILTSASGKMVSS